MTKDELKRKVRLRHEPNSCQNCFYMRIYFCEFLKEIVAQTWVCDNHKTSLELDKKLQEAQED